MVMGWAPASDLLRSVLRACWQNISGGCLLSPCTGIPQLPYRLKSLAAKRHRSFQQPSFSVPAPGPFLAGRELYTNGSIRVSESSRSAVLRSMPRFRGFELSASIASFTILPPRSPLSATLARFPTPFDGCRRYGSESRSSRIRSMHGMERMLANRIRIS